MTDGNGGESIKKEALAYTMDDDVVIRAIAWGNPENPPVILSHGGGQTLHSWGATAETLAQKGWYTIAYDHRGHGESDWCPAKDYRTDRFALDQRAIALGLSQPPVVIGASLGGISSMIAEGEWDEDVFSALVFVDVTPKINREGVMNIIGFMGEKMYEGFADVDEAADVIAEYTKRPRRKNTDGLAKNLRLRDDGRYYWHWDPGFVEMRTSFKGSPTRLMDATEKITQPILLIRGQRSDVVTDELVEEFLEKVPHAKYTNVTDARHMIAGDRNDIFCDAVVEFLDELA